MNRTILEWTETDGRDATLPQVGEIVIVGREYDDGKIHAEFVAQREKKKMWHLGDGRMQRIGVRDIWTPAVMEGGD